MPNKDTDSFRWCKHITDKLEIWLGKLLFSKITFDLLKSWLMPHILVYRSTRDSYSFEIVDLGN